MHILLDSNMLLYAIKFRVDIVNEARKFGEPFTLNCCINEIKGIAERKGRYATQAKIALQLTKGLSLVESKGPTDRAILNYALKHNCAVATSDKKLIKALKLKGIRVFRLRQKRYLAED